MKTLILGLGNLILSDDGVGIKVTQKIKETKPALEVMGTCESGITLLDHIVGYDKLVIIDSIKTEQGKPGDVYKLELKDFKPAMDVSLSHGMDIATAFEVGGGLGCKMPQSVSIYAIEIKDNLTFAEECSEEVGEKIPLIAKQIIEEEKL